MDGAPERVGAVRCDRQRTLFRGNAALAGVCDVIIATPDANLGMAGPAMIEGGGSGTTGQRTSGPLTCRRPTA